MRPSESWGQVIRDYDDFETIAKKFHDLTLRDVISSVIALIDLAAYQWLNTLWAGTPEQSSMLLDGGDNEFAPISSVYARTTVLCCLGVITADEHSLINSLRKLRNHCGHRFELDISAPDFLKDAKKLALSFCDILLANISNEEQKPRVKAIWEKRANEIGDETVLREVIQNAHHYIQVQLYVRYNNKFQTSVDWVEGITAASRYAPKTRYEKK